jgi:tetratricopeptide (TPR) repeat protein
VSDAAEGQKALTRIDKATLRVPRYAGSAEPPPIPLFRAHSAPGGALVPLEEAPPCVPLTVESNVAGAAEIALARADPEAALRAVEGADVPDALRRSIRARAALMGGDVASAREALDLLRADPACAVADVALSLAEGDHARAAARAAEALSRRPDGLAERYASALVRVAEGDLEAAQQTLAEVARACPDHAVARFQLGQILLASGDGARAGTLFEMAWQMAPRFVGPAVALAEMLADSRQYGEVMALLGAINETAPDATAPRLLQLRVLLELGEKDAALSLAEMLRAKLPNDLEVALLAAETYGETRRYPEARAALAEVEKAEGVTVLQRQRGRRVLARMALSQRPPRGTEAVEALKAGVRFGGPLSGELAVELFHVAIALGRKPEAEGALELIVETDDPSALISGAVLARGNAMWEQARKLGALAKEHVAGTPAEGQLEAFLAALPPA